MSEEKKTMYGENLDKGTVYGENIENGNNNTGSRGNSTAGEQPVTPADYTGMPGYEEEENAGVSEVQQTSSLQDGPSDIPEKEDTDMEDDDGEEKQGRRFFRSRREGSAFSREEWILTHIGDENLMEYLELEHKREELLQKTKEARQKRILSAFQLAVSLAAVVTVIWLLRDNPIVMVNILYIIGIVCAIWIWKNPRSK